MLQYKRSKGKQINRKENKKKIKKVLDKLQQISYNKYIKRKQNKLRKD